MVRPIRSILLYNSPIVSQDAQLYYANSDTPNTDWKIKESNEKGSFTIDNGLDYQRAQVLYEITLPFINNISVIDLNEILNDEFDLLSNFRLTLKNLLNSIIESDLGDMNSIYNDKLRPEIDTINRKFKTVNGINKIGTKATIAAFTISLIAVNTDLGTNFQTLFNTFAGTSTLGFLASAIKYKNETDKIKDNPYFLLWRINKANKSIY